MKRYKVIVHIPEENMQKLLHSVGEAGAGQLGEYKLISSLADVNNVVISITIALSHWA